MPRITSGADSTRQFFKDRRPPLGQTPIVTDEGRIPERIPDIGGAMGLKMQAKSIRMLKELGDEYTALRTESELYNALADWSKVSSEIETSVRSEAADYNEVPKLLEKRLKDASQESAKQINVRGAYDLFHRQVVSDTTKAMRRASSYVKERSVDEARARLNVNLYERLQRIHRDPSSTETELTWIDGEIESKVRTGILSEQKGEELKRTIRQNIDGLRAEALIMGAPKEAEALISNPEMFPNLDEPSRLAFIKKSRDAHAGLLEEERQAAQRAEAALKKKAEQRYDDNEKKLWLLKESGRLSPGVIQNYLAGDMIDLPAARALKRELKAGASGAEVKDDSDTVADLNYKLENGVYVSKAHLDELVAKGKLSGKTRNTKITAFERKRYAKGLKIALTGVKTMPGDQYDPNRRKMEVDAGRAYDKRVARGEDAITAGLTVSDFYLDQLTRYYNEKATGAFRSLPIPDTWMGGGKADIEAIDQNENALVQQFQRGDIDQAEFEEQSKIYGQLRNWALRIEERKAQRAANADTGNNANVKRAIKGAKLRSKR